MSTANSFKLLPIYPSVKGLALLLVSLYLLMAPVFMESDLVASALILCLFILCTLFFLANLTLALIFKKNLKAEIFEVFSIEASQLNLKNLRSKNNLFLDLKLNCNLFPFFHAKVSLIFNNPTPIDAQAIFTKNSSNYTRISIVFPHRGEWRINQGEVELGDIFGIWKTCIITTINKTIKIYPAFYEYDYPLIQSSEREGDLLATLANQQGDFYDIKKYSPTDGLRKIVWKVFARTNQLLSRHPEPTMSPEGMTAIFIVGNNLHDLAYSAAVNYTKKISEEGFNVMISAITFSYNQMCTTPEELEELSINTAWNKPDISNLYNLIETCKKNYTLKEIALFVDFSDDLNFTLEHTNQAIKVIQDFALSASIMIANDKNILNLMTHSKKLKYLSTIKSWFWEELTPPGKIPINFIEFIKNLESQNFKLYGNL